MFTSLLTGSYTLRPDWLLGQPLGDNCWVPYRQFCTECCKECLFLWLIISICGLIHFIYVHAVIKRANMEEEKKLTLQTWFHGLWDDMEIYVSKATNYTFCPTEWGPSSKAQHQGIEEQLPRKEGKWPWWITWFRDRSPSQTLLKMKYEDGQCWEVALWGCSREWGTRTWKHLQPHLPEGREKQKGPLSKHLRGCKRGLLHSHWGHQNSEVGRRKAFSFKHIVFFLCQGILFK